MKLLKIKRVIGLCSHFALLTASVFLPRVVVAHTVLLDSGPSLVDQALDEYRHHDYEKARIHLEANLKILPGNAASHELLGIVLDLQGEHEAARDHLEE